MAVPEAIRGSLGRLEADISIAPATAPFPGVLTSLDELRGVVPPPSELPCRKVIDALDRHRNTLY